MHARIAGALAFAVAVTTAIGAFPGTLPVGAGATRAPRNGKSVGSPTEGHLVGGVHLDAAPYLRVVPADEDGDVQWGLGSLVGLIDRAARAVRRRFPDATLSVGQLSRRGGGDVERHASHESGRDADVAFYVKNQAGKPVYAEHFVAFRGDGTAPTWPGATFDDAKNWELVAALLTDPQTRVSHIFVALPLRARLLAYAARAGASASLRSRASEVLQQPRGALPHDDHFHVRIACPAGMRECIENPLPKRRPTFARVAVPHGRNRGLLASKLEATTGHAHATTAATASAPGAAAAAAAAKARPTGAAPAPATNAAPAPAASPSREATGAPTTASDASTDAPAGVLSAPIDDVDGEL